MVIRTKYEDYTDEKLIKDLKEYLDYVNWNIKNKKLPYRYNDLYHLGEVAFKLYHLYVEYHREHREYELWDAEEKVINLQNELRERENENE